MVRMPTFATVCLYRSASTCKARMTRMRGSKGLKSTFNPEWRIPTRYSLTDWLVRNREMRRIENEEFDGKRANRVFYVCVLSFKYTLPLVGTKRNDCAIFDSRLFHS
jgi:hypothetical protein